MQSRLEPSSSRTATLWGGAALVALLGLGWWALNHGLFDPNVIERGQVSVTNGVSRVTARTRALNFANRSFWQVEVAPGDWRECGHDCAKVLRGAVADNSFSPAP